MRDLFAYAKCQFKLALRVVISTFFLSLLLGCQSLFFWPSPDMVDSPKRFGFNYQDINLTSLDNTKLHAWYLSSTMEHSRGTIYLLHGNGANLSYHIVNLYWLVEHGWNIFVIDYRGYGWSEGEPNFTSVAQDALAGYQWLQQNGDQNIIVFGQSLGGAIAVDFIHQNNVKPYGLILDSTFDSHRKIFQEVLGKSWIFWAFQIPLSWGVEDARAPSKLITELVDTPILIVHSDQDWLIDKSHAELLYLKAKSEKQLWISSTPGHLTTWDSEDWRAKLVCQLNRWPNLNNSQSDC